MNLALRFLIVPIVALLWRIGGKGGFPGARYSRRIGVPVAILVFCAIAKTNLIISAIIVPSFYIVSSLPNTLIGDNIWKAWWWIPIKGFLYGSCLLWLDFKVWELALWSSLVFSIAFTFAWYLSNKKSTGDDLPHHELEVFVGAFYGLMVFIIL